VSVAAIVVAFVWDVAMATSMINTMQMNDFGKFYYSAQAFLGGRDMYAPSPATALKLDRAPELQFLNMNPPHFHLLVLPLAVLTPSAAVSLWLGINLCALTVSILLIAHELEFAWTVRRTLAVTAATLAFAGTQAFFATGQLSPLLLLATTVAWRFARHGRWDTAAVWLGICASVKPFLLIFMPYLLLTGRVRAFVRMLSAGGLCFLVGVLVFGWGAHVSWLHALTRSSDWAWTPMNGSLLGLFTRAFTATPYFVPLASMPLVAHFWWIAAVIVGIASLYRHEHIADPDNGFAILMTAALLISPLGWVYYAWLPVGPALATYQRSEKASAHHVLKRTLAGAAGACLIWPLVGLYYLQPSALSTITIGSSYFWGVLMIWLFLVTD
jgi:alpha-1,2-mannosyltransferase